MHLQHLECAAMAAQGSYAPAQARRREFRQRAPTGPFDFLLRARSRNLFAHAHFLLSHRCEKTSHSIRLRRDMLPELTGRGQNSRSYSN